MAPLQNKKAKNDSCGTIHGKSESDSFPVSGCYYCQNKHTISKNSRHWQQMDIEPEPLPDVVSG
jgi:hypothetical protein